MYISFDCVFLCLYLNGLDCRAEAYLSSCILSSLSFLLDTLKEYFEQYGQVKEVTIKYDRETQKSRSVWYRTRNLQLCCPCGTCSILVMCTQDSDFGPGVVPQICDNVRLTYISISLLSCRGFAFVHFIEEESVQKALDAGDHTLDDREIDVKKAIPHAQHQVILWLHSPCVCTASRPCIL